VGEIIVEAKGVGGGDAGLQAPKTKFKKYFGDTFFILYDLHFSLNLVSKSVDNWYTGMLKNLGIYTFFLLF